MTDGERRHRYAAVCYMVTGALWLSFSWCVVTGRPLQAIACLLLALVMSGLADRLTR